MKLSRILTILVIVAVLSAIIVILLMNKKKLDDDKKVIDRSSIPVSVTVSPVTKFNTNNNFTYAAIIYAKDEAIISAETAGKIQSLHNELGTYVKKGEVIGKIDAQENEIKLKSAQLSIEKLSRDYERNKVLVAGNATNANAVRDSKYDLDSKKLDAAQLNKQIANSNIIAPISGIIIDKKMVAGEYANVGSAIATVVDVYHLKVKVYVPELNVFKLKQGQKVTITTDVFPTEKFSGAISYISPKGDDNHNYLVEIIVENNAKLSLKAGVYVLVTFNTTGKTIQTLQIPKIALVEGIKNPYVYIADNNKKAIEKHIILGKENGEYIEVLNGLNERDKVIISGQINIVNGSNVKVIENK
jgi:RND family efflux transporter, MFP subunit